MNFRPGTAHILIAFIAALLFSSTNFAGETSKVKITWVKYDEGLKLAGKLDKIIFVDFYTDWCKFCHKMDKETFSDSSIINYFNENFIAVKVNAESTAKMTLPDGRVSGKELSRQFGVRGYPTYWFLKPNGEKINYVPGYSPPDKFLPMLQYIGGKYYENMTFKEFIENNSKKD
jgi:thioredoxin-related protein